MAAVKVILKQDLAPLGQMGDVKTVAGGYARNYLLPRGLVLPYSEGALGTFAKRKAKKEESRKAAGKEASRIKERLEKQPLDFQVLVDEKGDPYGSVGKGHIVKGIRGRGLSLPPGAAVDLDHPLKTLGEHPVTVRLGNGISAKITVRVLRGERAK